MISVAVRHNFSGFALDAAFELPASGITVLFGPSGCGKSTLISAIAGLLRPDSGRIAIDGIPLCDVTARIFVPVERRRVGLVFQDSRLFPHLSVLGNLHYGLKRAPPGPMAPAGIIDLLGLAPLLDRRPHALSGGERQRVAIGRALLSQPRLLLMDEPLASLDVTLKAEIMPFLARLRSEMALPIVYVTHAMDEVSRLADTVVLMNQGRVLFSGPLSEAASRGDLPLAQRDDAAAILTMVVAEHDETRRLTRLNGAGVTLLVPKIPLSPQGAVRVRVPAREVILATAIPESISLHNIITTRVRAISEDTEHHAALVELVAGDAVLLARVTPDAVARLQLAPGVPVLALIKSMAIEVL